MIALDTNVLVRFLVQDDARQTQRAATAIRRLTRRGETLFLGEVVLAELVWVLDRSYRFTREEIGALMRKLLTSKQLVFASAERLSRAVQAYERGRGGLADYLIREAAREAGCTAVLTFDRALQREDGFSAP